MRRHCSFSVPFVAGKQRPRHCGKVTYTPKQTRDFERLVLDAFERERDGYGVASEHVPVHVSIETWRPIPKSRPKSVVSEPDTFKPDGDNITKLILDALNGRAWHDDSQVVELHVTKHDRTRSSGTITRVDIRW